MSVPVKRDINIVLLGKTGEGKSSTGNLLLGCNSFHSSSDKQSATKDVSLELTVIDGIIIKIVDTPGLCDTHEKQEVTLQNIFNAMALCPLGFDALIYVISYTGRFTSEDVKTLDILKKSFGPKFLDYCIIVVTHGINFDIEEDQSFEHWCKNQRASKDLGDLFKLCNNRAVLFYNKIQLNKNKQVINPADAIKQKNCVKQLLQMIQQCPGRYKNADFEKCAVEREKLILQDKLPQLTVEIQEKLGLLKNAVKKAAMNIEILNVEEMLYLKQRARAVVTEIEKKQGKTGLMKHLHDSALTIEDKIMQLPRDKNNRLSLIQEIEKLTENLKNPPGRKMMIFKYVLGVTGAVVLGAIALTIPVIGVATAVIASVVAVASGASVLGAGINLAKDEIKYESDVEKFQDVELKYKENKKKLTTLRKKDI